MSGSSAGKGGTFLKLVPGIALSAALAAIAVRIGALPWCQAHGISALTAAIGLGLIGGNTLYRHVAPTAGPGVAFSKQTLLRTGVIFYGLRLTLADVSAVGGAGLLIDALMVSSTFLIAAVLGPRLFRLDRETSVLIGAGSAICGAAAVMATEPIVRAKADHVTIGVSTVVVFGTLSMVIYPLIHAALATTAFAVSGQAFGIYIGSTVHEVAQVFAAGRAVSEAVANTAVITKMVRVMMLAPFLMVLSAWLARRDAAQGGHVARARIPWFAVGFIGMVVFNSFGLLPPSAVAAATQADTFLLATAMAALGLTTHVSALRAAGPRPLWLGALLFAWLVAGGGALNLAIGAVAR